MTVQKIEEVLPELCRNFLPEFFKTKIPKETDCACNDCTMLRDSENGNQKKLYFSSGKCCTYYPNIPNYLVGGLLNDNNTDLEEGRRRIREIIKSRTGVLPHGIKCPKKFYFLMLNSQKDFFGRSKSLICPYYEKEKGECTIWCFRNAVCRTWFCKHIAGYCGKSFWLTLKKYLENIEKTLIQYTLYKMDLEPHKIIISESTKNYLTIEELDDQPPDQKTYQTLWDNWIGREEEFYRKTYKFAAGITREAFEYITGISQKILLEELKRKHHEMLKIELPKIVKRNSRLIVKKIKEDHFVLLGYSPYDFLEVTKREYEIIDFFDGYRTNEEVFTLLQERKKEVPSPDLLLRMYRSQVLIKGGIE